MKADQTAPEMLTILMFPRPSSRYLLETAPSPTRLAVLEDGEDEREGRKVNESKTKLVRGIKGTQRDERLKKDVFWHDLKFESV